MSRPKITFDILKRKQKCLFATFDSVAELADYKAIYRLQAFSGTKALSDAISTYCAGKPTLIKKIEDFANDPINYNVVMQDLINNISSFKNVIVPSRDCDFVVDDKSNQDVYIWVNERIEISHEHSGNGFYVAKLNVDEQSDSLLFNNGEDGWTEYGDNNGVFSGKVAGKYKEYLAEKQLLKD
jgi:hypothetical protein